MIKKIVKPLIMLAAALLVAMLTAHNGFPVAKNQDWVNDIFKPVSKGFYSLDAMITDRLYTHLSGTDNRIVLIKVDEETLGEYGNFNLWSREKTAELLEFLYSDPENRPAVVTLDFLFVDETDPETDARLAAAADLGDVVVATNLVYRGKTVKTGDGRIYYDSRNIEFVEEPYGALEKTTLQGFSNACIANDGYVRYAMNTVPGTGYKGLAYATYERYCQKEGLTVYSPGTDAIGQYRFIYSGMPGEFSKYSLRDVLKGNVPASKFNDKIVMVGAYASGFRDDYAAPVSRGTHMYGVEIHANIVQSLFEKKTAVNANRTAVFVIMLAVTFLFLFAASKQKLLPVIIESVVLGVAYCLICKALSSGGWFVPVLYFLLFIVLADVYYVIAKYFLERWNRRRTLEVFKKYVAPQVVDDLSKSGDFVLKLGGEKRNVAVLFVDIRGFTPLSESMEPEQVVAILNEYLALTTKSILDNRGTLDKFIGDATMAVFNAPFDLEDYVYAAVSAAWDIKTGSRELGERLYREFGKQVGFGVGVNCGPAVVGNIGCEFRMDYTAIGDTVNTAARLESNAKAEEILISEYVYEKLKDRIETEPVGEIPLKGKSTKIMVYRVLNIHKERPVEGQAGDEPSGGTPEERQRMEQCTEEQHDS